MVNVNLREQLRRVTITTVKNRIKMLEDHVAAEDNESMKKFYMDRIAEERSYLRMIE